MSASPTTTERPLDSRWRLAEGLAQLGEVQDSGLTEPTYLVQRADGQVLQLSQLLNLVLSHLEPTRTTETIASTVSTAYGRRLTVEGLEHLLASRLVPLGLVTEVVEKPANGSPHTPRDDAPAGQGISTGTPTAGPTAKPLLSLSLRGVLLPARLVPKVARILAPLFWPPVVVAAIVAAVALDVRLLAVGDLALALTDVLTVPALMLALYLILTVGGLVHETGHAAACAYGGGRPGAIGVGVYLIFPAFYTDVTDSYRLSRRGRLRTDLGGLYFNVLCLVVLSSLYLVTGQGVLLLAVLVMHIEMAQQLVPAVRLDGYYVLADLAGVPDLFARVGPVLRSLRPGAAPNPRVAELRPGARRVVVAWVAFVVPTLVAGMAWLVWNLPFIVSTNLDAIRLQATQWEAARQAGDVVVVVLASISMLLLVVPLLGLLVLFQRLAASLWRLLARFVKGPSQSTSFPPNQEESMSVQDSVDLGHAATPLNGYKAPVNGHEPTPSEPTKPQHGFDESELMAVPLTAAAFRDELMLPAPPVPPTKGWRRAVYRASGRAINPGPGPEERQRMATEERLRTPISGSHRIVVMSRKGGVGKTTITFALGSTFASLRGDRVIAVDANPDAGNLAHRVAKPNERTATHLLEDLDQITTYSQLRTYTSQARESRLEVLGSDDDPHIGMALGRDDYHDLIGLLDRFYNLIVLDTGTGILDSANQGLLEEADQLVLVLRAGIDGGRAAASTLDWLESHDEGELVRGAVVVINAVRKGVGAPIEPMVEHFEERCRRVVLVPWDEALEVGAQTNLSSLRPDTRHALVEMTAAVADGFVDGAHR